MKAYISGIGWVFPGSSGNRDNIRYHASQSFCLPNLTRKDVLSAPYKNFGRMDSFSKLGFAAISYALMDAKLDDRGKRNNASIIASTVLGCLETDLNYYKTVIPDNGSLASPALFAYTLPNCFLGEVSIYYGLTGENFVINQESTCGLRALSMALAILETGFSDTTLCGICDIERPDLEDMPIDLIPGSLFFVIEKGQKPSKKYYGIIEEICGQKKIVFNESEIYNLINLAEKCLKGILKQ